jgi:phosphotriesterase-related protein
MVVDVLGNPLRPGPGAVLFHEHIQFGWPGFDLDPQAKHGIDEDEAAAALEEVAAVGISAIVDATPIECGRDLERLARIASRTSVQVVGATGIYHRERGFPAHLASLSVDELVALYAADLRREDGAPAGIVKVATASEPFAKRETKAVTAAGVVSRELGAKVVTHTDGAATARKQLELLLDAGAVPANIVLGHLDGAAADDIADLASAGVFIGLDRFGHGDASNDDARAALVADLKARGLLGSLLIAHDAPLLFLGRIVVRGKDAPNPFTHIHRTVLPRFQAAGLDDADIEQLLVHNPRRFLGGAG